MENTNQTQQGGFDNDIQGLIDHSPREDWKNRQIEIYRNLSTFCDKIEKSMQHSFKSWRILIPSTLAQTVLQYSAHYQLQQRWLYIFKKLHQLSWAMDDGCSLRQIRAFEKKVGCELPSDFRVSLMLCNGFKHKLDADCFWFNEETENDSEKMELFERWERIFALFPMEEWRYFGENVLFENHFSNVYGADDFLNDVNMDELVVIQSFRKYGKNTHVTIHLETGKVLVVNFRPHPNDPCPADGYSTIFEDFSSYLSIQEAPDLNAENLKSDCHRIYSWIWVNSKEYRGDDGAWKSAEAVGEMDIHGDVIETKDRKRKLMQFSKEEMDSKKRKLCM